MVGTAVYTRAEQKLNPHAGFSVENLQLDFRLPDPNDLSDSNPVILDGSFTVHTPNGQPYENFELNLGTAEQHQTILSLSVDGQKLVEGEDYILCETEKGDRFVRFIKPLPDKARITTQVALRPDLNKSGEGLYISQIKGSDQKVYITQNEETGFRGILPFLDYPSVPVAGIKTTITAPTSVLPHTLSNGDLQSDEEVVGQPGWRKRVWNMPETMPSYLFALAAGAFDVAEGHFKTKSGKTVNISAYTEKGKKAGAHVPIAAMQQAMRFDEETYGFEYPFRDMKMVGVSAFNAGAMENNTLVIFNDQRFLADPRHTVDARIRDVVRVTAHEYFHTFTGNEVTIRDFSEPALKEGLTNYRESQFMVKMFGPGERVRRIKSLRGAGVILKRGNQFGEDASPFAHAVFPSEKDWPAALLYDATTYDKGGFLYGVLHKQLGDKKFYAGMRLYRERFSGKAANFNDFIKVMQDASGQDLTTFRRWFTQAGTPEIDVKKQINQSNWLSVSIEITVSQSNTGGGLLAVPLQVNFSDKNGKAIQLQQAHSHVKNNQHTLLTDQAQQTFVFKLTPLQSIRALIFGMPQVSYSSHLLPVKFKCDTSVDDLLQQMRATNLDPLLRYEASQQLLKRMILDAYDRGGQFKQTEIDSLITTYRAVLADNNLDPEMKAYMLEPPASAELALLLSNGADFRLLQDTQLQLAKMIGKGLQKEFAAQYAADAVPATAQIDPAKDMGGWAAQTKQRTMRACALGYLEAAGVPNIRDQITNLALNQNANITERMAALELVAGWGKAGDHIFDKVRAEFKHAGHQTLLDDLSRMEIASDRPDAFQRAQEKTAAVLANPSFTANDIRSTALVFIANNKVAFHSAATESYRWAADIVCKISTQGNHRLAMQFLRAMTDDVPSLTADNKAKMRVALGLITNHQAINSDTRFVLNRALQAMNP